VKAGTLTNQPASSAIRASNRATPSAAKLKKRTHTNLYNERPAWLPCHKKLDAAVAAAYG